MISQLTAQLRTLNKEKLAFSAQRAKDQETLQKLSRYVTNLERKNAALEAELHRQKAANSLLELPRQT